MKTLGGRIVEFAHFERRLAYGAFWSLVGAAISRGSILVSGVIVGRIIGKHDFGQFGMVQSTVGMLGTLAGFGMGLTATKHVAEYRILDPARAGRIITLSSIVAWGAGTLMMLVLILLAPWLSNRAMGSQDMTGLLYAGAPLLLFGAVNGAQTGALAGFESFKTIARVNVGVGVLSFPISLVGAWSLGVLGAVLSSSVCMFLNCVLNFVAVRKESARLGAVLTCHGCFREASMLSRFSLPAVLSGLVVPPVLWAANALLVNLPGGYDQLGVLNAIYRIKQMPEAALATVLAPVLPLLSADFSGRGTDAYRKTLSTAFALSSLLIIPISIIQTGWPALTLMPFGEDFSGYEMVVRVSMLQAVLTGLSYPLSSVLASMNRMWFGFAYNVSYAVSLGLIAWWLVPSHGAMGLALAAAGSHFLTAIPCVAYIYSKERAFIEEIPMVSFGFAVLIIYALCFWVSDRYGGSAGIAVGVGAGLLSGIMIVAGPLRMLRRPRNSS